MSACDRRTFVQTAALVSLLTSVLAASSAEAAGQAGYFVIAEVVAKPGSADELRSLLVPFAEKSRTEPGCQVYTLLEVQSEPGRFSDLRKVDRQGCARSPHDYAPSQGTRPEARQCSREAFHAALHERAELTVRILVLIGFVSLGSKG